MENILDIIAWSAMFLFLFFVARGNHIQRLGYDKGLENDDSMEGKIKTREEEKDKKSEPTTNS